MARKRKVDPAIKTTKIHTFQGNKLGDKVLTKEERDKTLYPFSKYEYEGGGLPTKIIKEGEHPYTDLTLDIRIFHDKEGTLELAIYKKGAKRYKLIPFEGLSEIQACHAKRVFETNIKRIIENACFALALASYEKQTDNFEKKKAILNGITNDTSTQYKVILELGHEKIIEESEENGIKTIKSKFIDVGAPPQTKKELEQERRKFLEEVYSAFQKFKRSYKRTPKQKDLMIYLFNNYSDKQKKISEMLKKHSLKFSSLWLYFSATDNIDDFINNVILTIRVTGK